MIVEPRPDPRRGVIRRDLTGQRFGRWTVVGFAERVARVTRWLARCDCGTERVVAGKSLVGGESLSCGCLVVDVQRARMADRNTTHGDTGSLEYQSWAGMLARCRNPNADKFPIYGGRGISVCDRWLDYAAFLEDMGRRPTPSHSIDRIDVNGNYEPRNCRWATPIEQAANRRPRRPRVTP